MQRLPQFLPRCNKRRRLGQGREVGMPRVACDDLLLCGASSLPFLGVAVVLWLWWCPGWWERKMWAHGIKGGHTSWKSWPVGFYAEDRYNLGRKAEFHTCLTFPSGYWELHKRMLWGVWLFSRAACWKPKAIYVFCAIYLHNRITNY